MGWILLHIRKVDDGRFRKSICEALCACYILQAFVVMRAQYTDRHTWINWFAILFLTFLAVCYGKLRFGESGNLIKIYELPSASSKAAK